jgi:hypothetical protein
VLDELLRKVTHKGMTVSRFSAEVVDFVSVTHDVCCCLKKINLAELPPPTPCQRIVSGLCIPILCSTQFLVKTTACGRANCGYKCTRLEVFR